VVVLTFLLARILRDRKSIAAVAPKDHAAVAATTTTHPISRQFAVSDVRIHDARQRHDAIFRP